jgi:hypothetical protein
VGLAWETYKSSCCCEHVWPKLSCAVLSLVLAAAGHKRNDKKVMYSQQ